MARETQPGYGRSICQRNRCGHGHQAPGIWLQALGLRRRFRRITRSLFNFARTTSRSEVAWNICRPATRPFSEAKMSYSNFSAVSSEEQKAIERKRISQKLVVGSLPQTERRSWARIVGDAIHQRSERVSLTERTHALRLLEQKQLALCRERDRNHQAMCE